MFSYLCFGIPKKSTRNNRVEFVKPGHTRYNEDQTIKPFSFPTSVTNLKWVESRG